MASKTLSILLPVVRLLDAAAFIALILRLISLVALLVLPTLLASAVCSESLFSISVDKVMVVAAAEGLKLRPVAAGEKGWGFVRSGTFGLVRKNDLGRPTDGVTIICCSRSDKSSFSACRAASAASELVADLGSSDNTGATAAVDSSSPVGVGVGNRADVAGNDDGARLPPTASWFTLLIMSRNSD